jgi:hypothetical protein
MPPRATHSDKSSELRGLHSRRTRVKTAIRLVEELIALRKKRPEAIEKRLRRTKG